jgi:hypothetical protein
LREKGSLGDFWGQETVGNYGPDLMGEMGQTESERQGNQQTRGKRENDSHGAATGKTAGNAGSKSGITAKRENGKEKWGKGFV